MIFHETTEFYKSVVGMLQAMIVILDLDGRIVQVNSVFEKLMGYTLSEIEGTDWSAGIFPPHSRKSVVKVLRNLSQATVSEPGLTKIIDRGGKEHFVEWAYRRIRQSTENASAVLIVGRDKSEAVRNERKLKVEQLKLVERNKELSCLYGLSKIVANPEISMPDMIQSIVEILPPALQYPVKASAKIQLNGKSYATAGFNESQYKLHENLVIRGEKRGSIEVVYADAGPQDGSAKVSFLPEEHHLLGTIAHQVALMIEKKLADDNKLALEEQLRHADRLAKIGQLTAGVAHELNEPLGNILGFAQLATKAAGLSGQISSDLEHIIQASLHAREVIKKLMLFSRQMPHRNVRINLNNLIADGLSFIEPRFPKAEIDFRCEFDPKLPDIAADPSQLTQVLVNLVVNAVQAMPDGGTLTIGTKAEEEAVTLIVQDTGIGMEEEIREQIFLPFFTTKDVDQGTGLGLSVVHGIITSHGGKIHVHSRKGQGTRFVISFPTQPPDGESGSEPEKK